MRTIFEQLIDIIFPPKCVTCHNYSPQGICNACSNRIVKLEPPFCMICGKPKDRYFIREICEECSREKPPFIMARSAAIYDGVMKDAIHQFKFNNQMRLAGQLGRLLIDHLHEQGISSYKIDRIIPVPLSGQRQRSRGYNQAQLLANAISLFYGAEVDAHSLKKIIDTKPQFELSRDQRLENVKGAFASLPVPNEEIFLIDDIYTTGATAKEASLALIRAGAKSVHVLTLARAVEH